MAEALKPVFSKIMYANRKHIQFKNYGLADPP